MIYELIAAFYVNASDSTPRFRVPIGLQSCFFLANHLFEKVQSVPGYCDYHKTVTREELFELLPNGYDTHELKAVLSEHFRYDRIVVDAIELDILDDEGNIAPRGFDICGTFVEFSGNGVCGTVSFSNGDASFSIPLSKLRTKFNVKTLFEVMNILRGFQTGNPWTFNELRAYFGAGIDDAIEIVSSAISGMSDMNWNPEILHSIAVGMKGQSAEEKIVGFLHNVLEETRCTMEYLRWRGFSEEVLTALGLLTRDKKKQTYEEHVEQIASSGNALALSVKRNDLLCELERDHIGRHPRLIARHERALGIIEASINGMKED